MLNVWVTKAVSDNRSSIQKYSFRSKDGHFQKLEFYTVQFVHLKKKKLVSNYIQGNIYKAHKPAKSHIEWH